MLLELHHIDGPTLGALWLLVVLFGLMVLGFGAAVVLDFIRNRTQDEVQETRYQAQLLWEGRRQTATDLVQDAAIAEWSERQHDRLNDQLANPNLTDEERRRITWLRDTAYQRYLAASHVPQDMYPPEVDPAPHHYW